MATCDIRLFSIELENFPEYNHVGLNIFRKMIKQPIIENIIEDLNRQKMVFIAGPRQVGKTRLSWHLLEDMAKYELPEEHPAYLNQN